MPRVRGLAATFLPTIAILGALAAHPAYALGHASQPRPGARHAAHPTKTPAVHLSLAQAKTILIRGGPSSPPESQLRAGRVLLGEWLEAGQPFPARGRLALDADRALHRGFRRSRAPPPDGRSLITRRQCRAGGRPASLVSRPAARPQAGVGRLLPGPQRRPPSRHLPEQPVLRGRHLASAEPLPGQPGQLRQAGRAGPQGPGAAHGRNEDARAGGTKTLTTPGSLLQGPAACRALVVVMSSASRCIVRSTRGTKGKSWPSRPT